MQIIQSSGVSSQLLHGSSSEKNESFRDMGGIIHASVESPECVAGGNQHSTFVLYQPEAYFGQVGGFAYAIHSTEGHHVGSFIGFGLHDIPNDVDSPLWREQLHQ